MCTILPSFGIHLQDFALDGGQEELAAGRGRGRGQEAAELFQVALDASRLHLTLPVAGSVQTTSLPMQLKLPFWKLRMREPWKACMVETLAWPTFSWRGLGIGRGRGAAAEAVACVQLLARLAFSFDLS